MNRSPINQVWEDTADYVVTAAPDCPMCNQAWPTAPHILVSEDYGLALIGREHRRCPPKAARFLVTLASRYGRFMSAENIMFVAYSDQPDNAQPGIEAVGSGISAVRSVLVDTDYVVQSFPGRGYRLIKANEVTRGLTPVERAALAAQDAARAVADKRRRAMERARAAKKPAGHAGARRDGKGGGGSSKAAPRRTQKRGRKARRH